MIKRSIQEEDITIVYMYICASNVGISQYIWQIQPVIKGKINRKTVIWGDFNNSLSSRNRSSTQKIRKHRP